MVPASRGGPPVGGLEKRAHLIHLEVLDRAGARALERDGEQPLALLEVLGLARRGVPGEGVHGREACIARRWPIAALGFEVVEEGENLLGLEVCEVEGDDVAPAGSPWTDPRVHDEPIAVFTIAETGNMRRAAAIDFFVVPTATFRSLYVFVVLAHERRRIVHFNVTDVHSARWTGQQVINAFPYETAPRYLHRDRDALYGREFISRVRAMGIEQVVSAARSPWQNPYVERVIGSLRRECTDHIIVTSAAHLRRVLREYVAYYNADRTHVGLDKDAPATRPVRPPGRAEVIALSRVGGLHHRYERWGA